MKPVDLNPVQIEIFKNALTSIGDEMALTVFRTAHSTVIKDGADFSTALCDVRGELLAQGLTIPLHLGAVPDALIAVINHFKGDLHPGDIVIQNNPYDGGMHLPDIFVIKPIFSKTQPDRLIAFAAAVAHHTDIGGRVPGSNASDSTEIYQEGIRFPIVKLYERGKVNQAIFDILATNVRVPDMVLGDLRATIAACHYGERELLKLADKYGDDNFLKFVDAYLDYTERLTRAEIRALPNGIFEAEDYIDDDGLGGDPVKIKVKLTIADSDVIVDFTGSARQVAGALNATESFSKACCYLSLRCVMESNLPNNGGYFRPIKVIAPKGTILNVEHPGACAARGLTGFRVVDTVLRALAKAVPGVAPAAPEGGNTFITIGGKDPEKGAYVHIDMVFGAWGGSPHRPDGDAMPLLAANCTNIPIETVEAIYPLRYEQYAMLPDTGGAGRYRGGLSLVRDIRLLRGDAILQVRSDRRDIMPWGLEGGRDGTPSWNYINPETNSVPLPSMANVKLSAGDIFRHVTGGAGGYGEPLERDPASVASDVRNGKITMQYARDVYGVDVNPTTYAADFETTAVLRKRAIRQTLSASA